MLVFHSGAVGIWDQRTGEHIEWLADREPFRQFDWPGPASNHCYLAALAADDRISVYEVGRNTNPLARSAPLTAECVSLAFAPDGQQLLIVEEGQNLRIWNWRRDSVVELEGRSWAQFGAVFSPDSRKLAIPGDGFFFRLWDTTTGRILAAPESDFGSMAYFLPGCQRLLTMTYDADRDRQRFRIWNAGTGDATGELSLNIDPLRGWDFAPLDSRRLCMSSGENGRTGHIFIYDSKYASLMTEIGGENYVATTLAISPDGNRLFARTPDDKAHIWVRQRPESRFGYMALPEFWLTATLTPVLLWSLYHDAKRFNWFPPRKMIRPPIPAWKRRLLAIRATLRGRKPRRQDPVRHVRHRHIRGPRIPRKA